MDLREFNIRDIEPSSSWLILGPPGSGKSTFVEDLVKFNKHKYPVCRIVTSVAQTHRRWCEIVPPIFVHGTFKFENEENFIKQRQVPLSIKNGIGKYCVYILDDVDLPKKSFQNNFFSMLFKQGSRHWCMMSILVNQYALEFPPEVRSAASYIVILKYTSKNDRQKIFKNYGGETLFGSETIFNKVLDEFTGNKRCVIIKQRSDSNNPEDSVFFYQISEPSDWKFGCKEIWAWNEKRCDKKKELTME